MSKYMVLYLAPAAGIDEWMKKPEAVRKAEEEKMMSEWNAWTQKNQAVLTGGTAGVGKPKRVTKDGIVDARNDIMLYSIIDAESHEAAAAIFKDHPHFEIPDGAIEVMSINPLPDIEPGS